MDKVCKKRTALMFTGFASSIAFLIFAANYPKYSLVAALCLLVVPLSFCYKEKVFFTFIFLYPLIPNYFAFDFGQAFPLVTVGRLLLVYVIVFDLLFNRDLLRKMKDINFNREMKIVTIIVVFMLFAYLMNYFIFPDGESFKILVSFVLENIFIAAYLFFRLNSSEDVELALKCFLFSAFFIAMTGIVEFVLRINVFSFLDIVKSDRRLFSSSAYVRLGENRIEGPFGHPLGCCNFLILAIPMGIYKWKTSMDVKIKTAYFFITLAMLVTFFLTLSRGPMLALAAGMLFYFTFTDTRTRQVLFMLMIVFAGTLVAAFLARALPGFARAFLLSLVDAIFMRSSGGGFGANSNASTYRLYLFELARKLVTHEYIWFGRGVSFFRLYEVYDWVPGISQTTEIRITSIDNFYILKYIQMGLTGLSSILLFIFSLIYSCAANCSRVLGKELCLCFLFIFISYFISLFTVDELGTIRFLWMVTGMLAAKITLKQV